MPRRGFGWVVTCVPSACNRSITPFQLEASAKAPCTRTTVGPAAPSCGFVLMVSSLSRGPPSLLEGGPRCAEARCLIRVLLLREKLQLMHFSPFSRLLDYLRSLLGGRCKIVARQMVKSGIMPSYLRVSEKPVGRKPGE